MRRLIIDGDWVRTLDDAGWGIKRKPNDGSNHDFLTIPDYLVTTVYDIPDLLPTEPGTVIDATIYGRRNRLIRLDGRTMAQGPWRASIDDDNLASVYYGDDEIEGWTLVAAAPEWRKGLVRLPDPEVTE